MCNLIVDDAKIWCRSCIDFWLDLLFVWLQRTELWSRSEAISMQIETNEFEIWEKHNWKMKSTRKEEKTTKWISIAKTISNWMKKRDF